MQLRQLETSEDDNIHVGTPVMKYGHGSTWLQLEGSVHSTLMTRSRVFAVAESEGERLLAAAGDEPTNTVGTKVVGICSIYIGIC